MILNTNQLTLRCKFKNNPELPAACAWPRLAHPICLLNQLTDKIGENHFDTVLGTFYLADTTVPAIVWISLKCFIIFVHG